MKASLWGVRGSLASFGPENIRFGGNTSCVAVHGEEGTLLVLDAGTGIRRLGRTIAINPGSDYATGTLLGALVSLERGKVTAHQLVRG